jgi:hypothetical protein
MLYRWGGKEVVREARGFEFESYGVIELLEVLDQY